MARKTAQLVNQAPFYRYLFEFYDQNRKKIRSTYTPLSRKFLDFNDPGKGTAFLRRPQFEALEIYVFLKEYFNNAYVAQIFKEWHERTGHFAGREGEALRIDELDLFETANAQVLEVPFKRMQQSSKIYPNYIYALTMGLGKTILMGTCIFYEFLLANKFPKDPRFCHNALVFAPDKTVLLSLKEIQTFDKSKVVPPEYVSWLDANLKFAFLDDAALSLQILENSEYNIIISNTQKIILKQSHKEKTAVDELFSADNTYVRVEKEGAENSSTAGFEDLYNFDTEVETEEELIANQRFEMLKRLNNLGIYVDEAHHAFGDKLEKDFSEKGTTSLRKTINELAACLKNAGSSVVACYNYTGTPYVKNMLLPEVVYAYSLKDAIDNSYLKKAVVKGYSNTKSLEFVRAAITEFWKNYGENRVEDKLPKIALFASNIDELEKELRPAVEQVLSELDISTDKILVNVGDDKITTNDDLREFVNLDSPNSEKQFILLVNKGKEGWNCRSLFAVALHRTPKSKIFVLQATMRCLRAIGLRQETGRVFLSEENKVILNEELQNNFRMNIDEFTNAGDSGEKTVDVCPVPPPVKVTLKRVRKLYQVKEKVPADAVDFKLDQIDFAKYTIIETTNDIERLDNASVPKLNRNDVKEKRTFTELMLVAEIARYLNKSCLLIRSILAGSKDGLPALLNKVNEYNELLYDHIIPLLFKELYVIDEFDHPEEHTLELVKVPEDGTPFKFNVKSGMLASLKDPKYQAFQAKSFHLDNYCFDSKPEQDLFCNMLRDKRIKKVYFTGMLTHGQTEFYVSYIDPETNTLRHYYPDFLVQLPDDSYVIVEVKGDNKIDDAVVQAKAAYATQMAIASGMRYKMIAGSQAVAGLIL